MSRPNIASADARLVALCREFPCIHDLVAQAREPASGEETEKGIWREELAALAALRDIAGSAAP